MINWPHTEQATHSCHPIDRRAWSRRRAVVAACAMIIAALLSTSAAGSERALTVGFYNNRPIVFQDASHQAAGVGPDVLNSIAVAEGWRLSYVYGSFRSLIGKLEKGQIDLLIGIAYTPERAQRLDFTNEALINNWGIVYRRRDAAITSLADMQGARVAVMSRGVHTRVFEKLMREFKFGFTPVEEPDFESVLRAVAEGRADAGVINRVTSILRAPSFDVLETGIIFNPVEVRIAAPKGRNADVLRAIDRDLAAQKKDPRSTYHASLSRWLAGPTKRELPRWLWHALVALAALVVVLLASNYAVRRRVAQRTTQLAESELRFRQLAENISAVFWTASPDWQKVDYVSPAYESVWQRTRASLYHNPHSWLDSVHPDDREAVDEDVKRKSSGELSNPELPEYRVVRPDGSIRWVLARAYPVHDHAGAVVRIAGIAEDITGRKHAEETIRFMAYHDPLTRLANRHAFERRLQELIDADTGPDVERALLYIDLDQFKVVNDTCGHAAGDDMLAELGAVLKDIVGTQTTLARLGGDEFGIIMDATSLEEAKALAARILGAIQTFRFVWDSKIFSIGASIGLVMFGGHYHTLAELLSAADMACYAAKEQGRNRIHVYSPDDADLLQRHGEMQWVARLKHALEDNRFVLHKQPIMPLATPASSPQLAEYLIRLRDEEDELVYPCTFISAAERFHLMPSLDRWVMNYVCAELEARSSDAPEIAFINLSGQALTDEGFVQFALERLQTAKLGPHLLCFEITETAAVANLHRAREFMTALRKRGCRFALDDFGSGMSSFAYLKSLPVDYLKIDGSFIKNLDKDSMSIAIVQSVKRIGHTAGLQTIAEWVESEQVRARLATIGIDYVQGYAIAKPGPLESSNQA
jgi:diguanylate cyclase (GGDEF)-like protein/PAS domain S-box-containing protein